MRMTVIRTAAVAVLAMFVSACSQKAPTAPTAQSSFILTVNDGTGSGNYSPGTVVNIVANAPPAGQVFDIWTGPVANATAPATTVTMPSGNVTVRATYKQAMAPPPPGVSAELWRVGFSPDDKLRYPKPEMVVLLLHAEADADPTIKGVFVEALAKAEIVEGRTKFFLNDGPIEAAVFRTMINPNLVCPTACTWLEYDPSGSGRVIGGRIEFKYLSSMRNRAVALHEILRTLGILRSNPKAGCLNEGPSAECSAEEVLMIRGRRNHPLLAVYAPQ